MMAADDDDYSSPMPLKGDGLSGSAHEDGDNGSEIAEEPTRRRRRFRVLRAQEPSERFTFRRRRDQDQDATFWNSVLVFSFLSLAVLIAIAAFLAQTDFFVEHQVDLLGTFVDEHFTVVSPERSSVYLKNSGHLPATATISFEDGTLRLGQFQAGVETEAAFHGVEIFSNGTVGHSNGLRAPNVQATVVHADSVIFPDGTTMTTAADVSGGLEQVGDLNFASQKGAIVASTSGQQRMRVNTDGSVAFPNADAVPPEDPTTLGIVLDGRRNQMTFGGRLLIHTNKTAATIAAPTPLALAVSDVILGRDGAEVARVTCRTSAVAMRLELVGQSALDAGGNVLISGGPGATGGSVTIKGGGGSTRSLGAVLISTEASAATKTVIGSNQPDSHVQVHGTIEMNAESKDLPLTLGGTVKFLGSSLAVASAVVTVGDVKTTTDATLAAQSIAVTSAKSMRITATEAVAVRAESASVATSGVITVNATSRMNLQAGLVSLQAVDVTINDATGPSSVHVHGNVALGAHGGFDKQAKPSMVAIGGAKVLVGEAGTTAQVALAASNSMSFEVNGSSLTIAPGANKTVAVTTSAGLRIGAPDTPGLVFASKAVHVQANQIQLGDESLSTTLHLEGNVFVNGEEWSARRRLEAAVDATRVLWHRSSSGVTLETTTLSEFRLWHSSSASSAVQDSASSAESTFVIPYPDAQSNAWMQLLMNVHGIRAHAKTAIDSPLLLRCRLVQALAEHPLKVLLEAVTELELWPQDDGHDNMADGIFPSLSASSVQPYVESAQHYVTCAMRFKRPHASTEAAISLQYDRAEVIVQA
ncbi:hypothetical protein ACHHYP_03977 [Achlya hypogyna]|uniref:Uncharacterized protein n=1 Tax=Achlya hypogyna TaxID=1202772 RepID=A0A1V9ZPH2_ACHHY|nr:hypothetical protein ACHHYP_03977 [Achlya hypogyna]